MIVLTSTTTVHNTKLGRVTGIQNSTVSVQTDLQKLRFLVARLLSSTRNVQISAPEAEQPHKSQEANNQFDVQQGDCEHQAEYKPRCSYYKSDKPHMGLYKQEYGQQIKEGYHPILNICAVTSELLDPVLDPLSSRKMLRQGHGWGPRAHKP